MGHGECMAKLGFDEVALSTLVRLLGVISRELG